MSEYLNDPEYLFSILTALVKRSDGKLTITEEELTNVTKGDLIGMYYEPETGSIVLKEVNPEDMLKASTIIRQDDEDDGVYDN